MTKLCQDKSLEQFVEGQLAGCKKADCERTCCDNDEVEEWVNEYFLFHEGMKDYLLSLGIEIEFDGDRGDRVRFKNCSDGERCKFLRYAPNKAVDPRPIDCKIYPFFLDWNSIDFNKKTVTLYRDKSCPLVRDNAIPDEFRSEVENIIKRDFAVLFYGARFSVEFVNEVYKRK